MQESIWIICRLQEGLPRKSGSPIELIYTYYSRLLFFSDLLLRVLLPEADEEDLEAADLEEEVFPPVDFLEEAVPFGF